MPNICCITKKTSGQQTEAFDQMLSKYNLSIVNFIKNLICIMRVLGSNLSSVALKSKHIRAEILTLKHTKIISKETKICSQIKWNNIFHGQYK